MTREVKTTIAPSDLVAIEFTCSSCHSQFTVSIGEFDRPMGQCPFCRQKWIPAHGGEVDIAITNLICYIKEYCKLAKTADIQMGVSVRFQLAPEKNAEV